MSVGPLVISLVIATAAFWPASGQGRSTIFEGARLITGDGRAPIENSAFVVQNDQFTRVGRRGEIEAPDAVRVDLTGKTVMPAKVDTHGHLGYENVIDGTTSKANYTRENVIDHLERFAYMGFSAVVSIADLAEREIMPGDSLDVFQAPRDPLMTKSGRFPWGDVPLRLRDEVSNRRPRHFVARSRRRRPPIAKRCHVPGDVSRGGSTCRARLREDEARVRQDLG
jgi:hypothetical protein